MPESCIRDLVELPRVRTVVQLADLENPELASSILQDFVLTVDSDVALSTLLESMAAREGQGFFLQGNFGSGKSHLLAVLDLLLRSDEAWETLQRQDPQYRRLARQASPSAMDMFSRMLDSDGDGDAMDDIVKMGSGLLGGLFKK